MDASAWNSCAITWSGTWHKSGESNHIRNSRCSRRLVHQQRGMLAKYQAVLHRQRRAVAGQMQQPLEVRCTPVRPLAEHEAAPREELEDVVARLEDLALEGLAAPHDIADALVRFAGTPDGHEFPGPIQAREIDGVAFVVLALDPRPLGDQQR